MPPKRGGGNGIFGLIMLPVSVMTKLVFYPANLAMWILVDKLGDERGGGWTYLAKRCLKNPKFKTTMQYVKDFRAVLYDYFRWPKHPNPAWRCKKCSKPSKIWCVECGMKFCPSCASNQHAPGVSIQLHSLEEIKESWKHKGVHLLSPILPEILLAMLFLHGFITIDFFTPEYLTTQASCPMVHSVQKSVAAFDTSLFYYMKGSFFQWCNMEDSYLRFILDAWVRSIVTLTDNTVLVFQTLPQALLFDVVLMYLLVPVVACLYAVLENVVYYLETRIPRTGEWGERLVKLEEVAQLCGTVSVFALGSMNPAPDTHKRLRPPMDIMDDIWYRYDRKMRHFKFVYKNTLMGLQKSAWHLITWTMAFRLGCIWLGLGRPLRFILSWIGFGSTIAAHQEENKAAHSMLMSENLLWSLLTKSLASATALIPSALMKASLLWVLLSMVAIYCFIRLVDKIVQQRREFIKSKAAQIANQQLIETIAEKAKSS